MIRLDPDKVRFSDPDAMQSSRRVHSVELSDERSSRQFLTVWTKGEEHDWAAGLGLSRVHDRATYHREPDPWIPQTFPGGEFKGWGTHYHLDLPGPPVWSDLERLASDIPQGLLDEIRQHLAAKENDSCL